jgi:hypothetical protein
MLMLAGRFSSLSLTTSADFNSQNLTNNGLLGFSHVIGFSFVSAQLRLEADAKFQGE